MTYLLAVDVGNTNVVMGVYDLEQGPRSPLLASWRMATSRERTSDEYGLTSLGMLAQRGIRPADIGHVVASSVVPPINPVLDRWLRVYFNHEPFWIEQGITTGVVVRLEHPEELGADRIVNAVAGIELYGAPLIAVDFGTRHHLRCGEPGPGVPGRGHHPRHRHQFRGLVPAGLAPAPGGDPRAGPGDRAEHGPGHAVGPLLRLRGPGGRHPGPAAGGPAGLHGHRHRRPGPGHRPGQQAHPDTSPGTSPWRACACSGG